MSLPKIGFLGCALAMTIEFLAKFVAHQSPNGLDLFYMLASWLLFMWWTKKGSKI